ncbi:hypothetical protein KPL70_014232 [Citrus sinensis]|nr:hypothetical protein KPL70_014232 [Citrus sinensis]
METSSTPSSFSSHISLSSTLSLLKSCSKHLTSKIENLVEYSYIPESAQINESQFPIMSPYNLYRQKTSFTRSIRISTKRPLLKEYIQSSKLDRCALQASQSEQYVTLEVPSDLVTNWKREGYTHLHLGGVRLIITLHGRKGLPVTARIALLDTRFKQYQHAVVGTVLTTFHVGSVLLTFYPNFNLSLEDPNLPTTLKNHALDLPTPHTTSDALMILADTDTIPTIIQIPKEMQKQDLLKLMPLEWLTNYEHFHQNSEPVQTKEATFERRQNGQVKLSFQTPETKLVSDTPQLSYIAMITTVQTGQEKKLPIHGFSSEGYLVYPDKINGHFLWDVPEAHMCNLDCPCVDDMDVDDELEVMRRKKKKKKKSSYPQPSCKSFPPQPPPDSKPPTHPIRSCLMFSSQSYEESFPPLKKQIDPQTRVTSKPFVQSLVTASGQPEEPKSKATSSSSTSPKQSMSQTHLSPTHLPLSTNSVGTSTDSESEYADITSILMATKTEDPSTSTATPIVEDSSSDAENQAAPIEPEPSMPPPVPDNSTKPFSASWFIFDDIPRHKWPARLQEFAAWIDLQGTKPNAQPQAVLREFMARSTGSLRDCHISHKLLEFCPENHSQFHHPSPLWKNEQFFIRLPFKLNKDINPTKASHPGMSPSDLLLAKQECSQLLQQGLIEPTDSDWACQAFYVEKRSKLVRVDRPKTAFCIPDAHYQWTVMPFGLKEHGIMISEKKSSIAKESIDFLGMVIKDGHYQPGPHIATELLKFPDTHLNKKQIQQLLRIVNYVHDLIPKVAIHTSQLSHMLRKQCPPWGPAQTAAVQQLKLIAQSPPPLRIPTTGQRILQTDASDDYWSAILLEEINGVHHFCAHASGQFKDFEKNYHVIYKEILAVKHGIKKFEFHLISHKFLINMDNSSFPRIFDFKNKLLPDKQLLSLKNWFAKYDFTVQHIKGKQNLFPDFLTQLDLEFSRRSYDQFFTACSDLGFSTNPLFFNLFVCFVSSLSMCKSPIHTENSHYTVTDPDPPAPSAPKEMTPADEEAYLQAEVYLDQRQIRRAKRQYEKATGDVSPSRYPSTP